jgi:hypothetical protein
MAGRLAGKIALVSAPPAAPLTPDHRRQQRHESALSAAPLTPSGRATVDLFVNHGAKVVSLDVTAPSSPSTPFVQGSVA